jgi:SAM-dependent methyltransferase
MKSVRADADWVVQRNETHYQDFTLPTGSELIKLFNSKWSSFHDRLMEPVQPLIRLFPKSSWLTVGDGKYGQEASYLQRQGVQVCATDIDTRILRHLQQQGMIKTVDEQNLEHLTYDDGSFDFVFAKETLHHLPRPFLGLYEMLRVAQKAIVLIEPQDPHINHQLAAQADGMKEEFDALLYNNKDFFFEPMGNYIYRLSRREIEKVALGLQRRKVAFRGINSMNAEERIGDIDTSEQALQRTIMELHLKDNQASRGLRRFEYLMAIIFVTDDLPPDIDTHLSNEGWDVVNLPENPYRTPQ